MSDVWLGAFIGLALYQTLNALMAFARHGATMRITYRMGFGYLAVAIVLFVLANLTYLGVIL